MEGRICFVFFLDSLTLSLSLHLSYIYIYVDGEAGGLILGIFVSHARGRSLCEFYREHSLCAR